MNHGLSVKISYFFKLLCSFQDVTRIVGENERDSVKN